ncbi:hypothetical protein ACFOEE_00175 [Pseudoalteromonas fenneropenaei]|uniref:Auto-transporter adhesin head GIN domain-containing protein n=1 Tax=Pseudoalteromonas fenneropenaei TaxID=1737459 RepID=A0ABV7CER6_9GAMM
MKIHNQLLAASCLLATAAVSAHTYPVQFESAQLESASASLLPQRFKLNCQRVPQALQHLLTQSAWFHHEVEITIAGECSGPIQLSTDGITLQGDRDLPGSIKMAEGSASAVEVNHAKVTLKNLKIEVPEGTPALTATNNSSVTLSRLTTNGKGIDGAVFYPFLIKDNSTAYISQQEGSKVQVAGSSVVEFGAGNSAISLNVLDTSFSRSVAASEFNSVEVSGNGYFLADNQTQVDLLMIWSKGAVDINQQSTVGHLMMGGQTLFAAYRNSKITGPYEIYGNVVFELEHSSADNWQTFDKPLSIFTGNNAVVNGTLYPSWSWAGQDGN